MSFLPANAHSGTETGCGRTTLRRVNSPGACRRREPSAGKRKAASGAQAQRRSTGWRLKLHSDREGMTHRAGAAGTANCRRRGPSLPGNSRFVAAASGWGGVGRGREGRGARPPGRCGLAPEGAFGRSFVSCPAQPGPGRLPSRAESPRLPGVWPHVHPPPPPHPEGRVPDFCSTKALLTLRQSITKVTPRTVTALRRSRCP